MAQQGNERLDQSNGAVGSSARSVILAVGNDQVLDPNKRSEGSTPAIVDTPSRNDVGVESCDCTCVDLGSESRPACR